MPADFLAQGLRVADGACGRREPAAVGTIKLIDGWLAFFVLAVVLVAVFIFLPAPNRRKGRHERGSCAGKLKPWLEVGLGFIYPRFARFAARNAPQWRKDLSAALLQKVGSLNRRFCGRCGLPFAGDITTGV